MSVWEYKSQSNDTLHQAMASALCLYCGSVLHHYEPIGETTGWGATKTWRARSCTTCGWWKVGQYFDDPESNLSIVSRSAAVGSLKELDLKDIRIPLDEVRDFLMARYYARFDLDPIRFEEIVASVFENHGYAVVVTSRSGDDGVDVILSKDTEVIGVQVKRNRGRIKVSQIRELLGALVVNGLTKGMFVTTSEYQAGAARTLGIAAERGFEVDLVDGRSFFEALRIAQRTARPLYDVEELVRNAEFAYISDAGVQYTGMHPEYKQNLIKDLRGPNGPKEGWP